MIINRRGTGTHTIISGTPATILNKRWINGEHIYGVRWSGGTSSVLERTDDAADFEAPNPYYASMTATPSSPFDNCMPWAGMVRVTDPVGGEMVAIPKFWYKLESYGTGGISLKIANYAAEGFNVSPAHSNRDSLGERDIVYVARYLCNSAYKSVTNNALLQQPEPTLLANATAAMGSEYYPYDWAMFNTIQFLYLVEYANWNSQACVGYGGGRTTGNPPNSGLSDSIPYHTGTAAATRATYHYGTQYRNIEGLWSYLYTYTVGMRDYRWDIRCFSELARTSSGGYGAEVSTGCTISTSGDAGASYGATSLTISNTPWPMYFPSGYGSSIAEGTCDVAYAYHSYADIDGWCYTGGYYSDQKIGMIGYFTYKSGYRISTAGARLMKIPTP